MTKNRTVIVIDDSICCREILKEELQNKGYKVETYRSAEAACALYCRKSEVCKSEHACACFLLTDNRMPEINGLDMIKNQVLKGCKIPSQNRAILSGSWTDEEHSLAAELGCKVFEKPYDFEAIHAWLDKDISEPMNFLPGSPNCSSTWL